MASACIHAKSLQFCPTLCDPIDCSLPGSSVHGNFPGKNTGGDCHFLLQGIFPNQRSNQHLLHWRWILYHWAAAEASISNVGWAIFATCTAKRDIPFRWSLYGEDLLLQSHLGVVSQYVTSINTRQWLHFFFLYEISILHLM